MYIVAWLTFISDGRISILCKFFFIHCTEFGYNKSFEKYTSLPMISAVETYWIQWNFFKCWQKCFFVVDIETAIETEIQLCVLWQLCEFDEIIYMVPVNWLLYTLIDMQNAIVYQKSRYTKENNKSFDDDIAVLIIFLSVFFFCSFILSRWYEESIICAIHIFAFNALLRVSFLTLYVCYYFDATTTTMDACKLLLLHYRNSFPARRFFFLIRSMRKIYAFLFVFLSFFVGRNRPIVKSSSLNIERSDVTDSVTQSQGGNDQLLLINIEQQILNDESKLLIGIYIYWTNVMRKIDYFFFDFGNENWNLF